MTLLMAFCDYLGNCIKVIFNIVLFVDSLVWLVSILEVLWLLFRGEINAMFALGRNKNTLKMISKRCLRNVVMKLFVWVFICCRIRYQLLDQVAHLLEGWLPQKMRRRMQWNMDCLLPTLLTQFAYPGIDIFSIHV